MSNNRNQVKKEPNGLFKAIGTQKLVAVIALIVLFMFFWIFGDNFAKYSTLVSIFDSSYYIGFMAIGVTFVIITGGIDLSIGTVCICCSLISGTLYTKLGLPMPLCVILAILMGGLFGLATGNHDDYQRIGVDCDKYGDRDLSSGFGAGRLIQRHFQVKRGRASAGRYPHGIHTADCTCNPNGNPAQ